MGGWIQEGSRVGSRGGIVIQSNPDLSLHVDRGFVFRFCDQTTLYYLKHVGNEPDNSTH